MSRFIAQMSRKTGQMGRDSLARAIGKPGRCPVPFPVPISPGLCPAWYYPDRWVLSFFFSQYRTV